MTFFGSSIYLVIFYLTVVLSCFVVAKILTQDWKLRLSEVVFILLSSVFILTIWLTYRYIATIDHSLHHEFLNVVNRIVVLLSLFVYIYKLNKYSIKEAVILAIFSELLVFVSSLLTYSVDQLFLTPMFDLYPHNNSLLIFFSIADPILSILLALGFIRISKNLRSLVTENERALTVLFMGTVITRVVVEILRQDLVIIGRAGAANIWNFVIIFGISLIMLLAFIPYTRSLKHKLALQQKEAEQRNLLFYIYEVEQQQTAMRKFKHDYTNILTSMHSYIQDKDWDGLENYYITEIEKASAIITQRDFALESLHKIKIREVKGIVAAKLILAQNMDIDVSFEADSDIDQISLDSVTLVRMLGIILDNAIEELDALKSGTLFVACFKRDNAVTFVVRNTCRADMPSLRELEQVGYSTKGNKRGLGLSNLTEAVNTHPNVTLSTCAKNGKFSQELTIGGI